MLALPVILDGDSAWPDLRGKPIVQHSESIELAVLDHGMASGNPSVAFRIELPDGSTVVAQTSARLFISAARIILSMYPYLQNPQH